MRFKTKVKIFRGKLNLAPLVDVFFLLLIFFLISTSFDFQRGLEVNLPQMDAPLVAGDKLIVVIASKGEGLENEEPLVFFNNEQVTWSDLEVKLAERINQRAMPSAEDSGRRTRTPTISLKADKRVPYGYIMRVCALANRLKVKVNQVVSPPNQ